MAKEDSVLAAREQLLMTYQGVLSTHSQSMPGYPFGSVVPYCLDQQGMPIILISSIAQHTKNIIEKPQVSLLVADHNNDSMQAGARLTLLCDAEKAEPEDAVAERYYAYFPESRDYHKTHNFEFYRLNIVRARFVGGFGSIHWIDAEDAAQSNPFSYDAEQGMVKHMNEDHAPALRQYCKVLGVDLTDEQEEEVGEDVLEPHMVGICREGFHIRVGHRVYWQAFAEPVNTAKEVRVALVDMAKR